MSHQVSESPHAALPAMTAYPMHGEVKLRREGWRTRDAHLMEWFSRLTTRPLEVVSRPEPWPRLSLARRVGSEPFPSTWRWCSRQTLPRFSLLSGRSRWWVSSASSTPQPTVAAAPVVAWNPLGAANVLSRISGRGPWCFDLLDDWTRHHAFLGIRHDVGQAYSTVLKRVEIVTANSEATIELARRFGREDAVLIPNGCDPDRFNHPRATAGPLTVGYGGKIGLRLDPELIARCARALPSIRFEFAGPVLDRQTVKKFAGLANVEVCGDVPYSNYPQVLQRWDVGWVPHAAGAGREVGGDAIKIYEYRAAGLPVFTTPIIGTERAPSGVRVVAPEDMCEALVAFLGKHTATARPPRERVNLPIEVTWRYKAARILRLLDQAGVEGGPSRSI